MHCALGIVRVEGFFLCCSVIRGTASSENVPLQIPSSHRTRRIFFLRHFIVVGFGAHIGSEVSLVKFWEVF